MSRVVNIKGQVEIKNMALAKEAIAESSFNISIQNNRFIFNQYDYNDGLTKNSEIQKIENIYLEKFNMYLSQLEQEEREKVEEEKRIKRESIADIAIANAKKQGYKLKKETREDNTIQLVFQKRIY